VEQMLVLWRRKARPVDAWNLCLRSKNRHQSGGKKFCFKLLLKHIQSVMAFSSALGILP
jgi:hypothetical protein